MEWFEATSGKFIGWLGVIIGAGIELGSALDRSDPLWWVVGLLVISLSWISLLRPRIGVSDDALHLRGMFSTIVIGWADVRTVAVSRFTAVWVGDKRYVAPSVGHTLRTVVRTPGHLAQAKPTDYASYVETRIRKRAEEATPEMVGVRRVWAWPEITVVGVLSALTVVLALA